MQGAVAVLDIGKTLAKLVLFSPQGEALERLERRNPPPAAELDHAGIWAWLQGALASAARRFEIAAIVPMAHGAAAALVLDGEVFAAPDYEAEIPADVAAAYEAERDPFAATLSPRLPAGLNLGAQLFFLERRLPGLWPERAGCLLWPQFWAWRLSGVAACEVTSLGCHSDLWRPRERRFSDLALRRGWSPRLGPLRRAADILGPVRPELAAELALPLTCKVHCGVHDSNAALLAARAHPEAAEGFSLVSTGTWFIAARSGGAEFEAYDPKGDMLAGVDVEGRPTPTARWMGGRAYEEGMGAHLGARSDRARLAEAAAIPTLPAFTSTPPPLSRPSAVLPPEGGEMGRGDPALVATVAALELARGASRLLDLLEAEGPILIEGRFARDPAMMAALAALRAGQAVYAMADEAAFGALTLARPDASPAPLVCAEPAML
ncbi:MAG TPA: carbohydrate kinase [Caulobacteraceae bacterium]|nr:carbohydrate kinase [Caulobacteraceae bacterium]